MKARIVRRDLAQKQYLSIKLGRDYGNPRGAWTGECNKATVFANETAARHYIDHAVHEGERQQCELEVIFGG